MLRLRVVFGLEVLEALQESLLHFGEAAVIVVHLVAEQEIADLVHAHVGTKAGTVSGEWHDVPLGWRRIGRDVRV